MKDTISVPRRERGDGGVPDARVEDRGRSGVALILVIGMLALMVVLGVTFSIYMRTERVAAGSFKSSVVARQLISVALNRALDAINSDLGNKPYPTWNVLESSNSITIIPDVTNVNSMAWIPRAALGSNQTPTPRWIDAGVDGRVGYLVVNCSGLLDANNSGSNGVTRSIGTNVNEIQISACPDVANVAPLVAGRPYETIQELGVTGLVSGALNQPVSNFVCYSFFPTGYPEGTNISLVDLSGDTNALMSRHTNIVSRLITSGIDPTQAEFVFTNLLDYVDADSVPQDLGSACTEAVPMFNEIQVAPTYMFGADTNFTMKGIVYIEWYYPFDKPSTNGYWIEGNVSFAYTNTPAGFPLPNKVSTNIDAWYVSGKELPPTCPFINFTIPLTNYASFMGSKVTLKAKVSLQMHEGSATGPVVDASPYPTNMTLDFTLPVVNVPNPASKINVGVKANRESTDPRYNWQSSQWKNSAGTGSLYAVNIPTIDYFNLVHTDGHRQMHVANRPLTSVTELTYLLRSQASYWNTIRLFDGGTSYPIDKVLDYFTVGTNTLMKGFVNPNCGALDVLTTVFRGMPLNNYPDEPPTTYLRPADAVSLALFWADTNQNPWRCNFAKLSDIGHATNVFAFLPIGLTSFQQESFFRNTAGLFNTRQQYFKILLFAQTAKTVPLLPDKSVLADVRAIAEVWRDPLPNAEGIHPCVVRMVHLLNND